jgi:hypothetical protein
MTPLKTLKAKGEKKKKGKAAEEERGRETLLHHLQD